MKQNVFPIILGCQMNTADFESVFGSIDDLYQLTDDQNSANLIVVTSCSVREKAKTKLFSLLGRLAALKKQNPDLIVAVTGCVVEELKKTFFDRSKVADILVGTRAITRFREILFEFIKTGKQQIDTENHGSYDDLEIKRISGLSGYLPIMRGCNNPCSYCIVPKLRGEEESRAAFSIFADLEKFQNENVKELWLIGQNVNSYRSKEGIDFPELLETIATRFDIPWIRFITSHPKDLSDRLIDVMAKYPNICPAIHLPLQSGSDNVLLRMNRGYTVGEYFEKLGKLRESCNGISITSDIMVGFPHETDDDHKQSLDSIRQADFDNIFLFIYSKRENTLAASFDNLVPIEIAKKRFDDILSIQREANKRKIERYIGKKELALVSELANGVDSVVTGRISTNAKIQLVSDRPINDHMVTVILDKNENGKLIGKVCHLESQN